MENRNAPRGPLYQLYLKLARASLLWERLWPALWPATAIAGIFSAAALLELFSYLPIWLHATTVIIFLVAFLGALQRAVTRLPRIDDLQAQHHIEQASDLTHRPLAALDDSLATGQGDAQAQALWQAHQARMAAEANHLKLGLPKAGLAKRDPGGMRAAVALLLIVGVAGAGTDSFNRLGRAILPELNALTLGRSVAINIWITPPAYTGLPPIVLSAGTQPAGNTSVEQPKSITVPIGSTILAQVNGGGALPQLSIKSNAKTDEMLNFNRIEADAYHVESELGGETLAAGDRLSIVQHGHELAGWPMTIVKDAKPEVEFSGAPEATPQLRLQLPFAAKDDYGVKSVIASIRRLDGKKIPGGEDEIIIRLPLPSSQANNVKGKSNNDLVSHVWAGLPVLVHLLATDEQDQTGLSQVEPVVLPERRFSQPAAKEVYEIRKQLAVDTRSRVLAGLKLDQLSEEPELFRHDNSVYLGLRVARERLRRDKKEIAVAQVQKMLWDIALKIEEGQAATAGAELRAAQKRLMEALDRNASTAELEKLMDEVQKALEKFMSSLMQELQQRGQLSPMDPNAQTMTNEDMKRMMDRARELMRQGSKDAAKQMMAELQRMLDNLRSALSRGGQQQRQSQQSKQAQQMMKDLRDIIQKQQKLLEDTHKRAQEDPASREQEGRDPNSTEKPEGLADQEGIRRQLGKMMQKLGEMTGKIPDGLGKAEREMRQSERMLGKNRPGESVGPQGRALDALRKGAQNSARALAQQMGRGQGRGRGQANGRNGQGGRFGAFTGPRLRGMRPGNRDPFGRRQQEEGQQGTATGRVKIPGESEMQRAREILDELRRRAGDLWRPEMELDYIERLLKRF